MYIYIEKLFSQNIKHVSISNQTQQSMANKITKHTGEIVLD